MDDTVETSPGVCNISCPGNSLEACGGNVVSGSKLRHRNVPDDEALNVYQGPRSTTTTSSSSETSSTTSASTPDTSSDLDLEPEKRNIQPDMQISQRKTREHVKLRRGGMLETQAKLSKARPE